MLSHSLSHTLNSASFSALHCTDRRPRARRVLFQETQLFSSGLLQQLEPISCRFNWVALRETRDFDADIIASGNRSLQGWARNPNKFRKCVVTVFVSCPAVYIFILGWLKLKRGALLGRVILVLASSGRGVTRPKANLFSCPFILRSCISVI